MIKLRLFVVGLLLSPFLSRPVVAQVLDPTFTPPSSLYTIGTVYALGPQQADGKRVVSGSFSRVNGTPTSTLMRLDASGALDLPFTQNASSGYLVYKIKSTPSGQYLLSAGGGAVAAGSLVRAELLRLNADGTGDASFDTGIGPVFDNGGLGSGYSLDHVVQPDGKVLVVGSFDTFNGTPAAGVVRLNANGSVDTGFSAGTGIPVASPNYNTGYAVAVQPDGKILVAGDFATFNGQPSAGVVRLNANGSIDPTFSSPLQQNSYVEGLTLQPDGKILLNGSLSSGNTANPYPGLVRLLPSGTLDTGFLAPSFTDNGAVSTGWDAATVLQPDGKILIIGYFTATGANYVARLNANGTQDLSFQMPAGPSSSPRTVGLQANGSVLVGGSFNTFNGTEAALGRVSASGAPDPAFAPSIQTAGSVTAMVRQPDGSLVLGGNFTEISGQAVHRLARVSATGALDVAFSANTGVLPGPVTCLALQSDGKVLAGSLQGVSRFASNGVRDASFSSTLSTNVMALQPDGRVLIGGGFSTVFNGTNYSRIVRLTSTGAIDPTFVLVNVGLSTTGSLNQVDALLLQPDGKVVVGGVYRITNVPTSVARVVRYDASGAPDAGFNPAAFTLPIGTSNSTNRVFSLALQPDGKILAGGNFGAVDNSFHYGVARLMTTGIVDASFAPDALLTGTVYAVAPQPNGRVLLGGSFVNSGVTSTMTNLVRLLDNGQTDVSFAATATPSSSVRALLVQPNGAIALAGSFSTLSGQRSVGVARITAANVLHVAAPAVAARTAAWPVPSHDLLHIAPDASAHPLSIELLDALGRQVRYLPVGSAAEQTISIDNLPTGTYLLRVSYEAGVVTRRIAVQ